MSYIGSTPTTQNFIAGTDSFNGTGSATNFTLSRFVNSPNDIQVVVNNVVQYPPNYSVSGNTLTISPAPSAGTNNVYVRYLSTTLQSITVPGGSSVVGNFGLSGNLQFLGSSQRITGDFSNATAANRVLFQSSTANGFTAVSVIPNGTSTSAFLQTINNSDPTNASTMQIAASVSESQLSASRTGTGTFLPMTFYTGGSERVRVDTSGNVGIGTSSPNERVTIAASTSGSYIQICDSSTGTTSGDGLFIGSFNGAAEIKTKENKELQFGTNNAERARIDSSGNLLLGTTTLQGRFTVTATGSTTIDCARTETTLSNNIILRNGNGAVGSIQTNGSTTAYNTSSDYRLKENVQPMSNALAKVAALKPVTYTWKVDGSAGEGFIAHELAEIVPQCVGGDKDAVDADGNPVYQGVDTSFLVATLTAALQEAHGLIKDLQARVDALEVK
jgi:hypothetical protein